MGRDDSGNVVENSLIKIPLEILSRCLPPPPPLSSLEPPQSDAPPRTCCERRALHSVRPGAAPQHRVL
jgi:hypothetical protein